MAVNLLPEDTMMKICKDCIHYRRSLSFGDGFHECTAPQNGRDLVTGKMKVGYADINRKYGCGGEAWWYVSKVPELAPGVIDVTPIKVEVVPLKRRIMGLLGIGEK